MQNLINKFVARLIVDSQGLTAVEYAVLGAVIVGAITVATGSFETSLTSAFGKILPASAQNNFMSAAGKFYRAMRHCKRGLAALEFALLAPVLLMLMFGIIIQSIYFSAVMGVRHAASEGARAAMAGLSPAERATLASARAHEVLSRYGTMLSGSTPAVVAAVDASSVGAFKVTVTYDMANSPIIRYGSIVPLPNNKKIESSVLVTNGGY